jgi:hypothetical protein
VYGSEEFGRNLGKAIDKCKEAGTVAGEVANGRMDGGTVKLSGCGDAFGPWDRKSERKQTPEAAIEPMVRNGGNWMLVE